MIFLMSKYVGVDSKHFDVKLKAIESGDPFSLFDKADSLFGKRSEIQDTHDRFVNRDLK